MDYNRALSQIDDLAEQMREMKSLGPGGEVNNMSDVGRHLLENLRHIVLSHERYHDPIGARERQMNHLVKSTFRKS